MLITQELILKHTNYAKMSKLCEEFEIAGNLISCEHNRFTPCEIITSSSIFQYSQSICFKLCSKTLSCIESQASTWFTVVSALLKTVASPCIDHHFFDCPVHAISLFQAFKLYILQRTMTGCYKIDRCNLQHLRKFSRSMKSTLAAPPRPQGQSLQHQQFYTFQNEWGRSQWLCGADVGVSGFVLLFRISTEVANYTHLALSM
jgi:hypothetical protein